MSSRTRAVVGQAMPWEAPKDNYKLRAWADEDDSGLRHYIEKVYGITGKRGYMMQWLYMRQTISSIR